MENILIHPSSIVETQNIGTGTKIWAFVHILPEAQIGANVNICDHCFIENQVVVGDNVTIKCGVYIWDGITIEDDVFVGPSVAFTNDLLPRSKNKNYKQQKINLKKGCSIGAGVTILAGCSIGSYAMIGAGGVVTEDIPDFALAYGNPAIVKGYMCACTKKLLIKHKNIYNCSCGRAYKRRLDGRICIV